MRLERSLILPSVIISVINAITTTSTITEIAVQTVTETLVAIGGIIQNVVVNLDNGNGHLWDYSTKLVTGEHVITIVPSTFTECATIYVYGEITLTSETTLITTQATTSTSAFGYLKNIEKKKEGEKNEVGAIISRMLHNGTDMDHLRVERETPKDEPEVIISI